MNFDFNDICIPLVSSLIVATLSFILFYYFKRSSDKFSEYNKSNQNLGAKKKFKKKINQLKGTKNEKEINSIEELMEDQLNELKHIEIKMSPEIIEDEIHEFILFNRNLIPSKPILKKNNNEEILVNEENCSESIWTKIPKDEVEILKSRHSSVASVIRTELKDEDLRAESKLSRGQKRRLKAKLKILDIKQNEVKRDIQSNNNNLTIFSNEEDNNDKDELDNFHEDINSTSKSQRLLSSKHPKSESLTSTNSSQISEKVQSCSSIENDERLFIGDFVEILQTDTLDKEMDENMNNYHYNNFIDDYKNNEEKLKLEHEVKELKNERYNLIEKLNEFSAMTSNLMALKKENDIYSKKYDDLERTCNAMKKELTTSIQKNVSTEGQFVRFKTEGNQQIIFYESEMSKLKNKLNILENDIRSKVADQDNLKNNIDKLHHMMSEKDKSLQIQGIEVSTVKDQLYKKRVDCQDLESQIKNLNLKLKEIETQNQSAFEENQSLIAQMDVLRNEKSTIEKKYDEFKRQTKCREREQDSIISNFQYQLDEFRREQQYLLFTDSDKDEKVLKNQDNTIVPEGYQLIESCTIKKFTSLINESNQKLQDKCDHYNAIIHEDKEKEKNLLQQNALLNDKYTKLKSEFESHLNEIVVLRECTEKLQQELSKNSDTTIEEIKLELEEKREALRKTEEILAKLELSVCGEETKWHNLIQDYKQENLKLENDLNSQGLLVNNQNKTIIELTNLLQSYNHSHNEAMFNGALSVDFAETSSQ